MRKLLPSIHEGIYTGNIAKVHGLERIGFSLNLVTVDPFFGVSFSTAFKSIHHLMLRQAIADAAWIIFGTCKLVKCNYGFFHLNFFAELQVT